jgi:hypothetical protein
MKYWIFRALSKLVYTDKIRKTQGFVRHRILQPFHNFLHSDFFDGIDS